MKNFSTLLLGCFCAFAPGIWLLYAFTLHAASIPALRRPSAFHAWVALAFLALVTTYFGVNFVLGGLHSYA